MSLPRLVVVGGSGPVGRALASRLETHFEVTRIGTREASGPGIWQADVLSIRQTEVALAGANVVVFLARTVLPRARLMQGDASDADFLLADSVARAAKLTQPQRLVFFSRLENDEREQLFRRSGHPLAVLTGGGDDPVSALASLVLAPGLETLRLPEWRPEVRPALSWNGGSTVLSVQRMPWAVPWTARQAALAYFEWLPSDFPLVRTTVGEAAVEVRLAGVPVLRLRRLTGECDDDVEVFEVRDGFFVSRSGRPGFFEFRRVSSPSAALFTTLRGFRPALPWLVYRWTQAVAHARSMRHFAAWLSTQTGLPAGTSATPKAALTTGTPDPRQ
jgi:hypothetical protein